MEASTGPLSVHNPPPQPNLDHIKRKLINHGVQPTPKILHNIRKKELQKSNRSIAKETAKNPPNRTEIQELEETHFQTVKSEYRKFTKSLTLGEGKKKLMGRPWERLERLRLRELASDSVEYAGGKLNSQHLRDLSDIIECDRDKFLWLLDSDVEHTEALDDNGGGFKWTPPQRNEAESVKLLVDRLSVMEMSVKQWKFCRIMRHSGLKYTERQMLRIVERLGDKGKWMNALSVVEWVYTSKELKHFKSRYVYTKLLKVLGRARKPHEALQVFNFMRGDTHIYPDLAAYHSLAVTLGQAGLLKDLLGVIESMKRKPKKIMNSRRKAWDPVLQPDIVIFNSVLNACVASRQWKGVSWVFQQLRKHGLRPNGASYGLAMEVMLQSGKYDLVHEYFDKMKRSGEALKSLTYKVLVRALWEEGKVDESVEAVRDMERRGLVGTENVYYELARCLCFYGRWQEAIMEVKKLKKLGPKRPLAVTYTGMILSSMDGGHVHDCISIFEHSKTLMSDNIGIINVMLKVYGRNDMFVKAKELFEGSKVNNSSPERNPSDKSSFLEPDSYTYGAMLEASACAHQWEYFEHVYKEMVLRGYQLDQNKHSLLLVEASKSGKAHLLQHALDAILKAGEIPPMSFFMEMACQAISQLDYERAVGVINTMAHAPSQVTFQQWIDLFEMNKDRLNQASLTGLQKILANHNLVNEVTALNFSRSLDFICGSFDNSPIPLTSITTATDNVPADSYSGKLYRPVSGHNRDGRASLTRSDEQVNYDPVSNFLEFGSEDHDFEHEEEQSDSDESDFEYYGSDTETDEPDESGIPSATEILETWKQMGLDGVGA